MQDDVDTDELLFFEFRMSVRYMSRYENSYRGTYMNVTREQLCEWATVRARRDLKNQLRLPPSQRRLDKIPWE